MSNNGQQLSSIDKIEKILALDKRSSIPQIGDLNNNIYFRNNVFVNMFLQNRLKCCVFYALGKAARKAQEKVQRYEKPLHFPLHQIQGVP